MEGPKFYMHIKARSSLSDIGPEHTTGSERMQIMHITLGLKTVNNCWSDYLDHWLGNGCKKVSLPPTSLVIRVWGIIRFWSLTRVCCWASSLTSFAPNWWHRWAKLSLTPMLSLCVGFIFFIPSRLCGNHRERYGLGPLTRLGWYTFSLWLWPPSILSWWRKTGVWVTRQSLNCGDILNSTRGKGHLPGWIGYMAMFLKLKTLL